MDISRAELIARLMVLIDDAQSTPLSELCERGDYNNQSELRYPQTKGEFLADNISTLLASQTWIDGETEPILDDMLGVVSLLDTNANRPDTWRELFDLSKLL